MQVWLQLSIPFTSLVAIIKTFQKFSCNHQDPSQILLQHLITFSNLLLAPKAYFLILLRPSCTPNFFVMGITELSQYLSQMSQTLPVLSHVWCLKPFLSFVSDVPNPSQDLSGHLRDFSILLQVSHILLNYVFVKSRATYLNATAKKCPMLKSTHN